MYRWTGTGGTASPQQALSTCGRQTQDSWSLLKAGMGRPGVGVTPQLGYRWSPGRLGLLRPPRAGQAMGPLQLFIQKSHMIRAVL